MCYCNEYPEENPYKVGDQIKWKSDGKTYTVGDDFGEIHKWRGEGGEKYCIVTTCGRVLFVDAVDPI